MSTISFATDKARYDAALRARSREILDMDAEITRLSGATFYACPDCGLPEKGLDGVRLDHSRCPQHAALEARLQKLFEQRTRV